MSNKKLFAIILSAVLLTSVVTVAAYKIFTKNPELPTLTSNPNLESIVDSIDYSENLLDSNAVYKEKFAEDLNSQGKWIPVKSSELIRELTSPPSDEEPPVVQNVNNETPINENTSVARNIAPSEYTEPVQEEVKTNVSSNVSSENVQQTETKTVIQEKIVYIWQPIQQVLSLNHIAIGGESLNEALVQNLLAALPHVTINNQYGPTEAVIDAIVLRDVHTFQRNIIGRPIYNTSVYVLDENRHLMPVGAVGELCIGGEVLAKGYYNRQNLTEEKFIDNPFNPGEKLYRTLRVQGRRARADAHHRHVGRPG